ncbi:hypothetical protein CI109_106721 [Kwoniella shandongensis]|uniref:alpha-1,2-Mannosidase n=1 Tax=Kwoniella shandongensis TaxID=1734106 RepID=A0AAJ8LS25_9TREE
MKDSQRLALRDETRALFRHGYEGYMKYAYPADELRPLSCAPMHRSPDPANFGINDIHANVSMTLLDTLSTLPLIHPAAYPNALYLISTRVSFDQDVKVQVFEMTIRALGALLSTYQYLDALPDDEERQAAILGLEHDDRLSWKKIKWGSSTDKTKKKVDVKQYRGRMLELAHDLGKRMLPAFATLTGLPYARVNLRHGVDKGESIETCTAGAGSLILEFALLSRLTGDDRFEKVAQRAYLALWNRRSQHDLLGNTIGVTHGHWLMPGLSGVGAGMDSFFEYGIKAGIMLDDDTYYDIFHDSYAAVQTHVRTHDGFIYRPVQTRFLTPSAPSTIDSLSAFLPGMQVLAGDIESAIKSHLVFWNLWRKYSAIPESWSWGEGFKRIEWGGWPGRPEFIESTYYLYQATRDPFYLRVGERVLTDLKRRTKTRCGFATIKNVITGELEDRMESFMLSETLKYLYLLFSDTPFPNSNKVFTTEGHPLYMPTDRLRPPSPPRRAMRKGENPTCPIYVPTLAPVSVAGDAGIVVGIEGRAEYEYARGIVFGWGEDGLEVEEDGKNRMWWDGGVCPIPSSPKFAFNIVLSPLNTTDPSDVTANLPPEDRAPGLQKVDQDPNSGNWLIHDVEGLRLGVRWRFDGRGYDVASIGPHRVRQGQQVLITDPSMLDHLPVVSSPPSDIPTTHNPPEVILRFTAYSLHHSLVDQAEVKDEGEAFLHVLGATALFGKDFGKAARSAQADSGQEDGAGSGWQLGGKGLRVVIPPNLIETNSKSAQTHAVDSESGSSGAGAGLSDGCSSFDWTSLDVQDGEEYVLLLTRGSCTFLDKLVNAKRVGASGILVVGLPPSTATTSTGTGGEGERTESLENDSGWTQEGLIRPSAEEDDLSHEAGLDEIGMVYTEYLVGEVVDRFVRAEKKDVRVEIFSIEGREEVAPSTGAEGISSSSTRKAEQRGRRRKGEKDRDPTREGKLMVGEWEIWNLRVVEKPPP